MFRPGAKVVVDKVTDAIVVQSFPEGSTSYAFPHYKVRVSGVEVWAVHVDRVGVIKRAPYVDSDPYLVDAVGAAGRW